MSLETPEPSQATLDIGTPLELARARTSGLCVRCPGCDRDVSETRKPHRVDQRYLVDHVAGDLPDEVPVFGWKCRHCRRVLALDPSRSRDDLGPDDGWLAVDATFADGRREAVLVPSEVILG